MSLSTNISLTSLAACLDDGRRSALDAVRRLAEESGLRVFLVGGPVRDAILGMPVLDLDFSVEGDATSFATRLGQQLNGRVSVYQRFGTATIDAPGCRVDLVTARKETYQGPGALPEVKQGTLADDLARRDFTVNAMALPLSTDGEGVIDPAGGLEDLKSGLIRALHSRSFVEDPTRMMRAVRYEQRFGFCIEPGTMDSLAAARDEGLMNYVSGDRWRHELERILDERSTGPPLLRAMELGLLEGIHPALTSDDDLRRMVSLSGQSVAPNEWLASLFASLSEANGEGVIERFNLTGSRAAIARDTISIRGSEQAILGAGKASRLAAILDGVRPESVSAWAKLTENPEVAAILDRFPLEMRCAGTALSGTELLDMGVPQGPLVGEILARLREARLDGLVAGEEEERSLALSMLSECQGNVAKQG